jgi:hypothetical protein
MYLPQLVQNVRIPQHQSPKNRKIRIGELWQVPASNPVRSIETNKHTAMHRERVVLTKRLEPWEIVVMMRH